MKVTTCFSNIDHFFTKKNAQVLIGLGSLVEIIGIFALTLLSAHISFSIGITLSVAGGCVIGVGVIVLIIRSCKNSGLKINHLEVNDPKAKASFQKIIDQVSGHESLIIDKMTFSPNSSNSDED